MAGARAAVSADGGRCSAGMGPPRTAVNQSAPAERRVMPEIMLDRVNRDTNAAATSSYLSIYIEVARSRKMRGVDKLCEFGLCDGPDLAGDTVAVWRINFYSLR